MDYLGRKFLVGIFLINFFMFISCEKEEEVFDAPVISWISPQEHSLYKVLDSVYLKVSISNSQPITLIRITLKNENHVPVMRSEDIRPNSNAYLLEKKFVLDDLNLNGIYYFDITVFNANGSEPSFRYINIIGKEKELSKLYVIESNGMETGIYELKSNKLFLVKKVNGDFLSSSMDHSNLNLITSGNFSGDINAISLKDSLIQWNFKAAIIPQTPFVNEFSSIKDQVVLASLQSGRLIGFNSSGINVYDFTFESGFKPGVALYQNEKHVIIERIDQSSGAIRLVTQYFPSGLSKANVVFNYGMIHAMFEMPNNEVLIFSNDGINQYILNYSLETEQLSIIEKLNSGEIKTTEKIGENLIALNIGGDIYTFDYINSRLSKIKAELDAMVMRYNEVNETVYCLIDSEIIEIDFNGNVLETISSPNKIKSFELGYR